MPAHLRFIPLVMSVGVALTACTSAATPAPTAAPVVTNAPTATPTTDGTLPKPELASIKLGSPIGIDQKDVELKLGLNMLVDLSKDKTLEWPAPGISVTNAFYKKYPNTVLVMVAASLEAMSVILHDRTTTVAEWSKFSQTDLATAGKTYDAALEQMNGDMTFTGSSFAFAQSVLAVVTPSLTTIDITKSYDGSLLKKLNDIGFYKKIGIPFPTKPWP